MVYHKCDTLAENQNNTQGSQNKFILVLNYLKKKKELLLEVF